MSVTSPGEYRITEPAGDARGFRNALGQYGTGVAVVAAKVGESLLGMTINSFAAVSLDPPLVLWSVRNASQMATAFMEAEGFAINVLSASQPALSAAFASDESRALAFETFGWSEGRDGALLLDGTLARFECRREAVYEAGDHHIILGHVEKCSVADGAPLLFVQGEYVARQPLLGDADDEIEFTAPSPNSTTDSFGHLLTGASYRLSQKFDAYRQRSGVTIAEGRILGRLEHQPMTAEHLATSTYLGRRAIDDALVDMLARGVLSKSGDVYALTDAGVRLRAELSAWSRELEQQMLSGLSEDDVRAARRVLAAIGHH